jgi:hypothetical protein
VVYFEELFGELLIVDNVKDVEVFVGEDVYKDKN